MTAPDWAKRRASFLAGMRHAACTVNVVTTDGPAGRFGITVSAMASVSADADRPILLICVNEQSASAAPILENGVFCVNVLRDDQSYISDCFAGRYAAPGGNKFACGQWAAGTTGGPRLIDCLVAFDCRLLSYQKMGRHYVIFGAVEDVFLDRPGSPLIYANRTYGTPLHVQSAASVPDGPGEPLRLGAFHTIGPYVVPDVLARLERAGLRVDLRLRQGDQRDIAHALKTGEIDIALVYDWNLGPEFTNERLAGLFPYVLLSEDSGLAAQPSLSLRALADKPMILLDAPPSGDYFLSLFRSQGLEPRVRFRSASFEMVRGMVGHGLGYTILVTKPASTLTYDGRALTTRPLVDPVTPRHLALSYRNDRPLRPVAEAFAATCRAMFEAQPDPAAAEMSS